MPAPKGGGTVGQQSAAAKLRDLERRAAQLDRDFTTEGALDADEIFDALKDPPDCELTQTYDPKTKTCKDRPLRVKRSPCAEGMVRDKVTKECRESRAAMKRSPCAPGEVRDKVTKECRESRAPEKRAPCAPGEVRDRTTKECRPSKKRDGIPVVYVGGPLPYAMGEQIDAPRPGVPTWPATSVPFAFAE